jgi:hypothetical protein
MSAPDGSTEDQHEPGRYEIRLKGHLDARWAERFAGLTLSHDSDGTTLLAGPVVDQAALYGVLRHVRDLGLPLLSVLHIGPEPANGPDGNTDTDLTNKETHT